jgi:hypothetical protein
MLAVFLLFIKESFLVNSLIRTKRFIVTTHILNLKINP